MRTVKENLTEKNIEEILGRLSDDAMFSDGTNILSASEIDLSNISELLISTDNKSITVKKENNSYRYEEEADYEDSDVEYAYSPYADGDKDPSKSFCDITPEGAKLEELLNITIGDILYLKREDLISRFNANAEDDGSVIMQRVPSVIFEAMDITRVEYSTQGRISLAEILMILKKNLSAADRFSILSIISTAVTDTLEMPGDFTDDSYIWNTDHFEIKASIKTIKEREFAALSFMRR